MFNNSNANRMITALIALIAVLATVIIIQVIVFRTRPIQYNTDGQTESFTISEIKEIDVLEEYGSEVFFGYSFNLAKAKRIKGSMYEWQENFINEPEDAVAIASIALNITYIGEDEFKNTCIVEHDTINKLWVVTFTLKAWPHGYATIIIDQYDGAVLYCAMPQPI